MKNPKYVVFRKEDKDQAYYWIAIKGRDKNEDELFANLFARLSKNAAKKYDKCAYETKNRKISSVYMSVTDGWLKAVPGKEHNNIVFFINDFEPIKDE